MKKYDYCGILRFLFSDSEMDEAVNYIQRFDGYCSIFGDAHSTDVDSTIDKALSSVKKSDDSRLKLCQMWSNAVRILRTIGVHKPELAFLVSDFYRSGVWLLSKGVYLHGAAIVADIINVLLDHNGPEMQFLSFIITSDNPYETARSYGLDYNFPTELPNSSCIKTDFSIDSINQILSIQVSSDEQIEILRYIICMDILNIIAEKNLDIDLIAFSMGIGRQTLIDALLHDNGDFSFYLQLCNIVKHTNNTN